MLYARISEKEMINYLMRLTNLDRDILYPALANASTLNEASTVLNDFVLKKMGIYENSKKPVKAEQI